jgi:hypothetical protein
VFSRFGSYFNSNFADKLLEIQWTLPSLEVLPPGGWYIDPHGCRLKVSIAGGDEVLNWGR